MITIKNVSKKFCSGESEITVLRNISFEVHSGEFLAITGRSGAGKSTLLYQLSLLDMPTEGEVSINGQQTVEFDDRQRSIFRLNNFGFIFQDYALLPTLTALENVMLPLLMQGKEMKFSEQQAQEALVHVGLEDKVSNLPSQLSGGQQQRVSIARSIVHRPTILFADEPTANLDSESSKTVLDIFRKLNQYENLTIVMVTHEPEYAKLAPRIIELLDGKVIHDTVRSKKNSQSEHHP